MKLNVYLRLVIANTYFCFFTCQNYNAGANAKVPVVEAFLSNIFLAIFAFLIAKIVYLQVATSFEIDILWKKISI